jgi:hypothetical protein
VGSHIRNQAGDAPYARGRRRMRGRNLSEHSACEGREQVGPPAPGERPSRVDQAGARETSGLRHVLSTIWKAKTTSREHVEQLADDMKNETDDNQEQERPS